MHSLQLDELLGNRCIEGLLLGGNFKSHFSLLCLMWRWSTASWCSLWHSSPLRTLWSWVWVGGVVSYSADGLANHLFTCQESGGCRCMSGRCEPHQKLSSLKAKDRYQLRSSHTRKQPGRQHLTGPRLWPGVQVWPRGHTGGWALPRSSWGTSFVSLCIDRRRGRKVVVTQPGGVWGLQFAGSWEKLS